MYAATHRRAPELPPLPWRTALALLITLMALLATVSTSVAAPAAPPADGQSKAGATSQDAPGKKKDKKPVWKGVPGTNAAHDTYGYPWPAAPDCDESTVSPDGCVNDGVGFFQGQCTSWVAHRLAQRNAVPFSNWFEGRHWGNASEWSKVAKKLGYVSDKQPSVGAVGWYARGHVSYVEDVNSDGSLVISEMNTDGHNGFVVHTVYPGDYSWPDRFLHLGPVVDVVDTTAPERPAAVTVRADDRSVRIRWSAPTDDVGIAGYRVLRNGAPLAETTTPTYDDPQASPGQDYAYSVVALDGAGNVSEPGTAALTQNPPASGPQTRRFQPGSASEVAAGDSTAVCGRLGSERDQRVGCRLRTLGGWTTVRTGRSVPWGLADTRTFLSDGGTIWFCRVLDGAGQDSAEACLPLDLAAQSWGYDRIGPSRPRTDWATWVASSPAPTRCGASEDRAVCSTLGDRGWRIRSGGLRTGDPLSQAFLATGRGVAFCRTVDGHAACNELPARRGSWGRIRSSRAELPHGRWVSRPAGPSLCLPAAGCRTLPTEKG